MFLSLSLLIYSKFSKTITQSHVNISHVLSAKHYTFNVTIFTLTHDVLYLLSYGKNGGRGFDFSGTLSKRIFVNYPRPTKSYFSPLSVPFFMVIKPQHTNKYNLAFTLANKTGSIKRKVIWKSVWSVFIFPNGAIWTTMIWYLYCIWINKLKRVSQPKN